MIVDVIIVGMPSGNQAAVKVRVGSRFSAIVDVVVLEIVSVGDSAV
jgi:hypothetical protein